VEAGAGFNSGTVIIYFKCSILKKNQINFLRMKNFSVVYHNNSIKVETVDGYRLVFPDDRWLIMDLKEDFSKTVASSDADTRQQTPTQWVITSTSGGPDWINREQLQVIGELISRKVQEPEKQD
jgi:hypothetical protein